MDLILSTWEQAGERPYEVLDAEGLLPTLHDYLIKNNIIIPNPIYRGTYRHFELQPNDIHKYEYITSWTESMDVAKNFIEDMEHQVIFCLTSDKPLNALYNYKNLYNEKEYIIAPINIKITQKLLIDNFILFHVIPI